MAKGNIGLGLNTIIVVDRCATFVTSSKTILCTWHNVSKFLDRRTSSRMIWESLKKDKFEEQVLEWFENRWAKFVLQVLGRTKDIFLKESKLGRKCEFIGFGNFQNERLRQIEEWLDIKVAPLHFRLNLHKLKT
jgi:hypothetical protein